MNGFEEAWTDDEVSVREVEKGDRWMPADVEYVRTRYPDATRREIASELHVEPERVIGLINSRRLRKTPAAGVREEAEASAEAAQCVNSAREAGGPCPDRSKPSLAPYSAPGRVPPDLLKFLLGRSLRDAARVLGISRGTVGRLRGGYWPDDPRRIMRSWETYKGARGVTGSNWFMRRVYPGDIIRHARRHYTAVELRGRVDESVAVTCVDGGLLVQTLELPAQRFALTLIPDPQDA